MSDQIMELQKPEIPRLDVSLNGEIVLTFTRDINGTVVAILDDKHTYDDAARAFVGALKPHLEALN